MQKHTPLLEWQIMENQGDRGCAPWPPPVVTMPKAPLTQRYPYRQYVGRGLLALLLPLAITGGWLWHMAQVGLEQIDSEISDAVQMDLAAVTPDIAPLGITWVTDPDVKAWESQLEREQDTLHTSLTPNVFGNHLMADVQMINLKDNLAVASFVVTAKDGSQTYRQTRFYQLTADGWLRSMPDAQLWGPPRHLESSHFVFHFRQNDAQVVAAVAPQMDALYTELVRNFGLASDPRKLIVEVTTESITGDIPMERWAHERLVVPSPALYLTPSELSDAALLVQSIALPLVFHLGERVAIDHSIQPRWRSALPGLKLWQLWNLEMPLAHWRHDIVRWLKSPLPTEGPARHSMLPKSYTELCAMHSLWMSAPVRVGMPLQCNASDEPTWVTAQRVAYIQHTRMDHLNLPLSGYFHYEDEIFFRSAKAVEVATVIEYAVVTYGHEQLPVLLAGLAHYNSWDALLPAVYGVSSSEFEVGWQGYLVQEYGGY